MCVELDRKSCFKNYAKVWYKNFDIKIYYVKMSNIDSLALS
jgi:hypothetical protein